MIQLEDKEEIVKIIRKHPFSFFVRASLLLFALLIPLLLESALTLLIATNMFEAYDMRLVKPIYSFLAGLWYLIMWLAFFIILTDYYLDRWIITNKRILTSDQIGLFNRKISTIYFEKIQDISAEVKGLIPTLLNFGTLHVQSAGESVQFTLTEAPSPNELKEIISTIQHDHSYPVKPLE